MYTCYIYSGANLNFRNGYGINIHTHSTSVTSVNLYINRKLLNLFTTIYVAKQLKSTYIRTYSKVHMQQINSSKTEK